MKAAAPLLPLLVFLETCSAFVPGVILGGRTHAKHVSEGRSRSSLPTRLGSTPSADAIDAVPSDVSSPSESTTSTTGTGSSDFDLTSELISTIEAGIGDSYIPLSESDKRAIEDLIVELEGSSGADSDVTFPRDLIKLDGRWKLLFSSNILGLGKLSPVSLKDVYQVIDCSAKTVTNVAYVTISPPLFSETWGKLGQRVGDLAKTVEDKVTFPVDFNINHTFEVSSQSQPAQIELVQKEFKLLNVEDPAKRSVALPALKPLAKASAGRFDTTFLSEDVRISRGRFGEVRVFRREEA